jgi:ribonuclease HI
MLVILCDGSSIGNPGPSSIGVIAWDRANNPRIIYPNYRYSAEIGIKTNMEAEWLALLHALSFACSKDITQEVYIFCDSQTVVKQANGIWKVKHDNIKPLYDVFLKMKDELPKLHIFWVPRQLVYLADKAAQKGVNKNAV